MNDNPAALKPSDDPSLVSESATDDSVAQSDNSANDSPKPKPVETTNKAEITDKKEELIQTLYGSVKDDMREVELILLQEFSSKQELLSQMLQHGIGMGGKRLRPALTLLSGRMCGVLNSKHFTCGAVMELIHLATLVHDDVLDEAALRRQRETINARWSNELAVLFGDLLLARAICLGAQLGDNALLEVIAQTSRKLCEGEILQVANRGNYNLSFQTYYDIIEGKTAALLECSCRLGAMVSQAPQEIVENLAAFGRHLGMAFQIVDDILDLTGSEKEVGKTLGLDLKNEKTTLSVLFALDCVSAEKKLELVEALKNAVDPLEVIRPWLDKTSALDFARKKAQEHIDSALQCLEAIPDQGIIQQPYRESLKNIANFVLARQY